MDGRILGKPGDGAEAREMLKSLRGREHQVVTGVAIVHHSGRSPATATKLSAVTLREYSDAEIESYVESGAPMDKAGAYGVQGRGLHARSQCRRVLYQRDGLASLPGGGHAPGLGVQVYAAVPDKGA